MFVLQSSEMRELDRKTIEDFGLPSFVLMERAGVGVVISLEHELGDLRDLSYVVLVGKGNNGGDGLVVARTLLDFSNDVTVVLLTKNLKDDPLKNLELYEKLGGQVVVFGEDIDLAGLEGLLMSADVIVDALLGIGIKGELKEPIKEFVEMVNMSPAYKVAVDIPTGVDSDTGKVCGCAVMSDLTVTFAYPKIGHVLYPGREYTGKLKVVSIGIPKKFASEKGLSRRILTADYVKELLPYRPNDSHKGNFGRVAIIAGSKIYKGAPLLTALGAVKSGAGLTYLFVPEDIHGLYTSTAPEIIVIPTKSCGGFLCKESAGFIMDELRKMDVIALGPGLTVSEDTRWFVNEILKLNVPVVLDADGLNVLDGEILRERTSPTVITPHPGEFARLTGNKTKDVKYSYQLAENFSKEHSCVTVLKGATTIITDGERTYFNITGNNALAKGGSGDVLTGIIASFIAQGAPPYESALIGVYIHGRTVEFYEEDPASFTPNDIIRNIGKVLKILR